MGPVARPSLNRARTSVPLVDDIRPEVRPAVADDVDAIVATVTAAFASDPAWSFIVGPGNDHARAAFARTLLISRVRQGSVWVTADCMAVAMWDRRPIEVLVDAEREALWEAFRADVGEEIWTRLEVYDTSTTAAAPARPYWYLGVLATHPDAQGRGLATAVLRPGQAAADAEEWDCWLETSTAANKSFYAGRGFTESVPFDVPGGPPTWWLRRPRHAAVQR